MKFANNVLNDFKFSTEQDWFQVRIKNFSRSPTFLKCKRELSQGTQVHSFLPFETRKSRLNLAITVLMGTQVALLSCPIIPGLPHLIINAQHLAPVLIMSQATDT